MNLSQITLMNDILCADVGWRAITFTNATITAVTATNLAMVEIFLKWGGPKAMTRFSSPETHTQPVHM